MKRREFLARATIPYLSYRGLRSYQGSARGPDDSQVAHILPTVSHDRFLIKISVREPLDAAPVLSMGKRSVRGNRTDTEGNFWVFDAPQLETNTLYELSLADSGGRRLCDPWPLRTFPSPDAELGGLRLLLYTCAGGREELKKGGKHQFTSLSARRRLLRRGLSFAPQAVVANGDHVYWDQTTGARGRGIRSIPEAMALSGDFDRSLPVLGSKNERVLKRAVGAQIAELYGTLFRSVPVFFLQDDHDYFEGDVAVPFLISFPPDPFMLRAARASQCLYFPEFLPDVNRPLGLGGASAADRPPGTSEAFGTLRYGRLLELLLWDCRRFLTLKGSVATFIPPATERWLTDRMKDDELRYVVHAPSVPFGWTAGKWGEWYPDVLADIPDRRGKLTTKRPKFFWQPGWLKQHDRILQSASEMSRLPLFLNGDLHSLAEGIIYRSGERDVSKNPVVSILTGPVSTSTGWPSAVRNVVGQPPIDLGMTESLPCIEENGFVIVDFDTDRLTVRYFRWLPEQGEEVIETLQPFRTSTFPRLGLGA